MIRAAPAFEVFQRLGEMAPDVTPSSIAARFTLPVRPTASKARMAASGGPFIVVLWPWVFVPTVNLAGLKHIAAKG